MPVKKAPVAQIDDPRYREKLERLYERRSNLDSLIRTLEQYHQYRAKSDRSKRKTA